MNRKDCLLRIHALVTLSLALLTTPEVATSQTIVTVKQIGPSRSDNTDPDAASGGRVNGIAVARTNNQLLFAASEWGGVFKSDDGGRNWMHLDGHVPTATWDVEIDPTDSNRIYATSFYDGRVQSRAGINISTDGGVTWSKPATAAPPASFNCSDPLAHEEPSAFGIAIDPANPTRLFVGTNCGVAASTDSGVTWTYIDPTPADGADTVWDITVHHNGIIDLCGDDNHRRSTDGGVTWTTAAPGAGVNRLPAGRCSIAASPDEPDVLFAVSGTTIRETDDGGQTWPISYPNPNSQGRIPFVEVNNRGGSNYDLWFGDVSLFRASCATPSPPNPAGAARCQPSNQWAGGFTRAVGGHDDVGAIVFDPAVSPDACPLLFSSDGGVYFNTLNASPDCQSPAWGQPTTTPQALWNWNMAGVMITGADDEHIYFGNQDTGVFGTTTGGVTPPNWHNELCCDGFVVAADPNRVLFTVCCFGAAPPTRLFVANPGMTGATNISTPPPGSLRSFQQLGSIINFGTNAYAIVTSSGVFVTTDIGANPIVWTELGDASTPANACGIQSARAPNGTISFFVKSGQCNGEGPGSLWRYDGTAPSGVWAEISRVGAGNFGIFAVDPTDANRIIASDLGGSGGPQMIITTDGGTNWATMPSLDALMIGSGTFRYQTRIGPTRFTGFDGYPQPTLVAIDPVDPKIMVAAGADSGVFMSFDNGTNWRLVTDPTDPAVSGVPHIPRARYAHFDHSVWPARPNEADVVLGTQGRSQWRITYRLPPPPPPPPANCALLPWRCGLVQFDERVVILECLVRGCRAFDPIPKNCLVKWNCPGCEPGSLCPPYFHIVLDGLADVWDATILDVDGNEVKIEKHAVADRLILSFQPDKEHYIDGQIGDYILSFSMSRDGKAGASYRIRSFVKASNGPLDPALLKQLSATK